jgi:hypothetical protein
MNSVPAASREDILPSAMDWIRSTPADSPELRRSPRPVIAQWQGELPSALLILFEDGTIHADGAVPVELLAYVSAEWHLFLRGKIA